MSMATPVGSVAVSDANRRRWQRYKLNLPVRVLIVRQEKTSIVAGRGTDIGDGGMAIFAGVEMRVEDEIFVEFTPPFSSEPLRVRATVRNRSGYNYGVEFACDTTEEEEMASRFRQLLHLSSGNLASGSATV